MEELINRDDFNFAYKKYKSKIMSIKNENVRDEFMATLKIVRTNYVDSRIKAITYLDNVDVGVEKVFSELEKYILDHKERKE